MTKTSTHKEVDGIMPKTKFRRMFGQWWPGFIVLASLVAMTMLSPLSKARSEVTPSMSEAELAFTIDFYVNTIGEQVDKEFATHPAKYKDKMEVSLPNETHDVEFLGWLIIAAGEHYQGSDALKKALFRVKNEVGWQTPPHWVSWEEHREAIVRSDPSLILRTGLSQEKGQSHERKQSVWSSLRPRVQGKCRGAGSRRTHGQPSGA